MDDDGLAPSPTLTDLLADPATSFALKRVLRDWSGRDPVDAANDAAVLARFTEQGVEERGDG